jgi:hypothetical protein
MKVVGTLRRAATNADGTGTVPATKMPESRHAGTAHRLFTAYKPNYSHPVHRHGHRGLGDDPSHLRGVDPGSDSADWR